MPGTVDERPNWSLALPVPLEDLEQSPTAAAIAEALNRRR
jgi:4-alpha-glucanotransferase